jgi:hypothetical protein
MQALARTLHAPPAGDNTSLGRLPYALEQFGRDIRLPSPGVLHGIPWPIPGAPKEVSRDSSNNNALTLWPFLLCVCDSFLGPLFAP